MRNGMEEFNMLNDTQQLSLWTQDFVQSSRLPVGVEEENFCVFVWCRQTLGKGFMLSETVSKVDGYTRLLV